MDKFDYLTEMMDGIKQYRQLKQQLVELEQNLLVIQQEYEDYYFSECTDTCIGNSIVNIVRDAMVQAGLQMG